jgi:ABC-type iron transport system FetAB permease component
MSLALIVAFLIDGMIGVRPVTAYSALSVALTLLGVFMLADVKLNIKALRKDLALRIFSDVALGYVAFYILKYWSIAFYILIMNVILTLSFIHQYTDMKQHRAKKNLILWVFIQQMAGFFAVYLGYYLASQSVTLQNYVKPLAIIFTILLAPLARKTTWHFHPKPKDVIAVCCVALGVALLELH